MLSLRKTTGFRSILNNIGQSPSTAAKSRDYFKIQSDPTLAIHDGLYPDPEIYKYFTPLTTIAPPPMTIAPPIQIYHPIFSRFLRMANDEKTDLSPEVLERVRDYMNFASSIKRNENQTNVKYRQELTKVLGITINEELDADKTSTDGGVMVDVGDYERIAPLLVELKCIFGEGGCDPSIQAGYSMRRSWIQPYVSYHLYSHHVLFVI